MNVILWATLTANGNYARNSQNHPPKDEALADFTAHVKETGNFIVGRKTFELFQKSGGGDAFKNIEIVILSQEDKKIPGVKIAHSPQEALQHLKKKGYTAALLAGGEGLHNTFLAEKLVDEIFFNIIPTLEDKGMNLVLKEGDYAEVTLKRVKQLGNGIIQLQYTFTK